MESEGIRRNLPRLEGEGIRRHRRESEGIRGNLSHLEGERRGEIVLVVRDLRGKVGGGMLGAEAVEVGGKAVPKRAAAHLQSEAIRSNQRQSEAIGGNQGSEGRPWRSNQSHLRRCRRGAVSEAIQKHSEALGRTRRLSEPFTKMPTRCGTQMSCNQMAIRSNQSHLRRCRRGAALR